MLLVSYVATIIFSLISALSNSYIMFAVFRFLTGFGITGISIISIVLSEYTVPKVALKSSPHFLSLDNTAFVFLDNSLTAKANIKPFEHRYCTTCEAHVSLVQCIHKHDHTNSSDLHNQYKDLYFMLVFISSDRPIDL